MTWNSDMDAAPRDGRQLLLWTPEGPDISSYSVAEPDGQQSMGHDAGWWGVATSADPGRSIGNPAYFREPCCQPTHWALIDPPESD